MKKFINFLKKEKIEVKENFNVKNLTTFKIGGKVRAFVKVKNLDELHKVLNFVKKNKIKYYILGRMSNVVINDGNLNFAIIVLKGEFKEIYIKDKKLVYVGSAVLISEMLNFFMKNNIGGLEFLAGIPGTIGGAVFMNAGAFGKWIGNYVENIYALDKNLKLKIIKNNGKIFSYKNSIFQKNKNVILGIELKYEKIRKEKLKKEMQEILKLRKSKHPLEYGSAGSFFKNPDKYAAGELIEKAGLKGIKIGGAAISKKHANFIINVDNAKFTDVVKLASIIKKKIKEKFGIKLNEEVRYIK